MKDWRTYWEVKLVTQKWSFSFSPHWLPFSTVFMVAPTGYFSATPKMYNNFDYPTAVSRLQHHRILVDAWQTTSLGFARATSRRISGYLVHEWLYLAILGHLVHRSVVILACACFPITFTVHYVPSIVCCCFGSRPPSVTTNHQELFQSSHTIIKLRL